jgi:hypothetical protein
VPRVLHQTLFTLEHEGDDNREEVLHVDDGCPVVAALLHSGGGRGGGRVTDNAEVDKEEVDDGVGRELTT